MLKTLEDKTSSQKSRASQNRHARVFRGGPGAPRTPSVECKPERRVKTRPRGRDRPDPEAASRRVGKLVNCGNIKQGKRVKRGKRVSCEVCVEEAHVTSILSNLVLYK